jgi:hypothetical protein
MFFNYDSFEIVAIAFIVSGIFTYSLYKSSPIINKESLVNTSSNSEFSNNLATTQLKEVGVQTEVNIPVEASVQVANTYVNTGMQTSARMWLESIRNWITEILGKNPNPHPQYVDVGVQTNATSLWDTVKQRFLEVCSVRSSDLFSIGYNKVNKWIDNLDPSTVESSNTINSVNSDSTLKNLIHPNDSTSNVSEVTSESNLDNLIHPDDSASNVVNRVYDITDPGILNLYMADETIDFEVIDKVHYAVSDNIYLSVEPSIQIMLKNYQ